MIKCTYKDRKIGDVMVSSGTVTGDLSSLSSYFSEYSSTISGLDGSWKGASHDSIQSKASEFASNYLSTVKGEMEAFASACDLYVKYKEAKDNLASAESSYNSAVSNKNDSDASHYSSLINQYKETINSLKSQIESQLAAASSGKLEATSISESVTMTSNDGSTTTVSQDDSGQTTVATNGGKDWSKDENFTFYAQGGGWKNYRYSNGGSNTMGKSGCGPTSMAMVLSSLGYNVNPNVAADWSADHGYHPKSGTTEGYFTAYAKEMGVNSKVLGKSSDNIRTALQNNELVILHVGPGSYNFTGYGHFMVARSYDSKTNKILIADPNRKANGKWYNLDEVVKQLKGDEASWSFSAGNQPVAT